jgi:ribonuclease J
VQPSFQDAWSWSLWRGYLGNDNGCKVESWFDDHQCPATHIHSSGHASPTDLRRFAQRIAPKALIPVHGQAWDGEASGFSSIRRLADGEPWDL